MSLFGLGSRSDIFHIFADPPLTLVFAETRRLFDQKKAHHQEASQWRLPPGEDLNEWLAINDTSTRWADGVAIKKPIVVSAPEYVDYLMEWIETQLDNESIFPQKLGAVHFPSNFHKFGEYSIQAEK
ncbi:MOB kinase activator-like 1A protein [Tanacetum coccineum]